MFTNSEQTAKLIELGFEKPSSIASVEPIYGMGGISVAKAYSIGELIEILDNHGIEIKNFGYWIVDHEWYISTKDELIDALYDCIVKLKELKKL